MSVTLKSTAVPARVLTDDEGKFVHWPRSECSPADRRNPEAEHPLSGRSRSWLWAWAAWQLFVFSSPRLSQPDAAGERLELEFGAAVPERVTERDAPLGCPWIASPLTGRLLLKLPL